MRPDVFLWEAGDACTKSYYRSPSKKAPTSGTSDYTTTTDAPSGYKWWNDAYCKGVDPTGQLFHPSEGYNEKAVTAANIRHLNETFCRHCAVRAHCLEDALNQPPGYDDGVCGGFSARKRKQLRSEYKRGTPVEVLIAKHDPGSGKKAAA